MDTPDLTRRITIELASGKAFHLYREPVEDSNAVHLACPTLSLTDGSRPCLIGKSLLAARNPAQLDDIARTVGCKRSEIASVINSLATEEVVAMAGRYFGMVNLNAVLLVHLIGIDRLAQAERDHGGAALGFLFPSLQFDGLEEKDREAIVASLRDKPPSAIGWQFADDPFELEILQPQHNPVPLMAALWKSSRMTLPRLRDAVWTLVRFSFDDMASAVRIIETVSRGDFRRHVGGKGAAALALLRHPGALACADPAAAARALLPMRRARLNPIADYAPATIEIDGEIFSSGRSQRIVEGLDGTPYAELLYSDPQGFLAKVDIGLSKPPGRVSFHELLSSAIACDIVRRAPRSLRLAMDPECPKFIPTVDDVRRAFLIAVRFGDSKAALRITSLYHLSEWPSGRDGADMALHYGQHALAGRLVLDGVCDPSRHTQSLVTLLAEHRYAGARDMIVGGVALPPNIDAIIDGFPVNEQSGIRSAVNAVRLSSAMHAEAAQRQRRRMPSGL